MVEITVKSMEQRVQETEEIYQGSDYFKQVKRVPYIVVNAEIKHKDNVIKSKYTFYDAEDMSFKEAQDRIKDMLVNGLTD
ncbi:hypothetical protein [Bacillus altitudinis]|uniref:hypothetical protein n=1 Tax=Bacillus altitudinis TaxID=293387 RepID=UPI003CEBB936